MEGDTNVMSISLLRLHDGRIAMLNLRKDDGGTSCIPWFRTSRDEGKTWSKPTRVVGHKAYMVVNNDRMIQLQSGRIIVPIADHIYRGPRTVEEVNNLSRHFNWNSAGVLKMYYSDDGGKTWLESISSMYKQFPDGNGLQEPGVVELASGVLWMYARAGAFAMAGIDGRQWESHSLDKGVTWTEPVPSQFRSPCSPLSVKRIPSTGHLLAVWNDHSGHFKTPKPKPVSWGRTPLVAAISEDDGKTWTKRTLLEKSPTQGFCYTAIHFADDAVLLAYCAGGKDKSVPGSSMVLDTLRVRRITLDELYKA
jgi:hypothetical protein